jgi:import inner membrane translocase subunit TIM17
MNASQLDQHGADDYNAQRNMYREPCPGRIWSDCGGAFAMGAIGGSIFHGIKGFRNSPPGMFQRVTGSTMAIRRKAPTIGGNFAVWGLLFSTFDCSLAYIRGQEDAFNAIASGALTGGALAIRGGWKAAGKAAIVGGLVLATIEGVSFYLSRMAPKPPPPGSAQPPPTSHATPDDSFTNQSKSDHPPDEPFSKE